MFHAAKHNTLIPKELTLAHTDGAGTDWQENKFGKKSDTLLASSASKRALQGQLKSG